MIYLMMTDQSFREVPDATEACVENGQVVCYTLEGSMVASFDAASVTAYGTHEALKDPDATIQPVGGGVRRERELVEAPLSSVRMEIGLTA
jgi:hypothetical protein